MAHSTEKYLLHREISSCSIESSNSVPEGGEKDRVQDTPHNLEEQAPTRSSIRKVYAPNGWLQCKPVGDPIRCRPAITRGNFVAGFIPIKCPLSER